MRSDYRQERLHCRIEIVAHALTSVQAFVKGCPTILQRAEVTAKVLDFLANVLSYIPALPDSLATSQLRLKLLTCYDSLLPYMVSSAADVAKVPIIF
eukprot:SAG11_NODE_1478_length_4837_cov_1.608485_4_plen_97_part_00